MQHRLGKYITCLFIALWVTREAPSANSNWFVTRADFSDTVAFCNQ